MNDPSKKKKLRRVVMDAEPEPPASRIRDEAPVPATTDPRDPAAREDIQRLQQELKNLKAERDRLLAEKKKLEDGYQRLNVLESDVKMVQDKLTVIDGRSKSVSTDVAGMRKRTSAMEADLGRMTAAARKIVPMTPQRKPLEAVRAPARPEPPARPHPARQAPSVHSATRIRNPPPPPPPPERPVELLDTTSRADEDTEKPEAMDELVTPKGERFKVGKNGKLTKVD